MSTKLEEDTFNSGDQNENNEHNPIDVIAEEIDADRIHLDSLRLDLRMSAKDYNFITRLPLSAKQLINILYEMFPPTNASPSKNIDTLTQTSQE